MRQGPNNRRPRRGGNVGGGGGGNSGGGGNRRPGVPNRNQSFDSNGPDVRIRGNAHQVSEKYQALARDAATAGDRVMAENYFQHAEHYLRIINAMNEAQNQQQSGSSHQQQNPSHGQPRHGNGQSEGQGRPNGRDRDQSPRDDRDRTAGQDSRPAPAAADGRSDDRIGVDPRDRTVTASEFGADPRQGDVRDQSARTPSSSSESIPNGPTKPEVETVARDGHGQETRGRDQGDDGNRGSQGLAPSSSSAPASGVSGSETRHGPATSGDRSGIHQASSDAHADVADTAAPRKRPGRPRKVKPAEPSEPSDGAVTDQSELL